ncbi:Peroxidase 4 [Morus notabilis]|uniref:Peroxidase n=2 Tax=Morus notabilis TaxID=981085 RepID=W9QCN8_9ROSA|nr:Peroxidase 4 [Morus notabilis]
MASSSSSSNIVLTTTLAIVLVIFTGSCSAQLYPGFYHKSCPKVFATVKSVVKTAISKENRIGASLLRLHFHDCFVNGCDGSILLDDTSSFRGEKTAGPNNNSARGFGVVDKIKAEVEQVCPGVVSCADILAIAARDSVAILGGPYYEVKVGRRDSKTASFSAANSGVIPPPTSTLSNLINRFKNRGLSALDMVALSGGHTIGKARCRVFRKRIYNETNIDSSFAKARQSKCPRNAPSGDNNVADLDVATPNSFDNHYFVNLVNKKGLLHSDQILFNGGSTDSLVKHYNENPKKFHSDFVTAIIKMGDIDPLTGSKGEIRKHCARAN